MNLIDLREFEYEIDKIILFEESEFIFGNTELEKGNYKRYFYKYNIKSKQISKINKEGIITAECASYNSCILNNYIYTNAYTVEKDVTETYIYRVSLVDGEIEKLYSTKKDVGVIILSNRYVLLRGSNYGMDAEHLDVEEDIQGKYDYAILCDLRDDKAYEIKDKRVILGIRDYFIPYAVNENRYIVFEEAYMEDWELEYLFQEGIKKEDFYRNEYRESINIIALDYFAECVKEGYETILFTPIHQTELTAWTRYFGMDDEKIYYRVKDFESKTQDIYRFNKKTLEKQLVQSIQMNHNKFSYSHYRIWNNVKNRKMYEIKVIDNKQKIFTEIFDGHLSITLDETREDVYGVVDDYVITGFWTEDEGGQNYKEFVKIKKMKDGTTQCYEGICEIIKDNVILFK